MQSIKLFYKIFLFFFLLSCFSCSYLPEPQEEDSNLIITETPEYILLSTASVNNNHSGIIFYPGGLVDPHAYITALKDFAIQDFRTVVILKVASNLAILDTQKASSVLGDFPDVNSWVVGGHSLGGSAACKDVFNNTNNFAALFLLASYSVDDLTDREIPMISIVGSRDGVIDFKKYDFNRGNLPFGVMVTSPSDILADGTAGSTVFYEIEGGNHAKFGSYGQQEGDNDGSITAASQKLLTYDMLNRFLESNNL